MNRNFNIVQYSPEYKTACLAAFKSNIPAYFTEEEIVQFESFLDHFESNVYPSTKVRRTFFYVILKNDILVGCGGFGDKEADLKISLAWGLIHRDFHKQNFGKKLLEFRLEEIRKVFPNSAVLLETTQFSAPFYEKYGFQLKDITKDFYKVGMDKHDLIFQYD